MDSLSDRLECSIRVSDLALGIQVNRAVQLPFLAKYHYFSDHDVTTRASKQRRAVIAVALYSSTSSFKNTRNIVE